MNMRELIPWDRTGSAVPSLFRDNERNPFLALHREMNRIFDDAFRLFDGQHPGTSTAWAGSWPNIEVDETDKEVRLTAEVPGLEEKDVEVLLENGVLTLKGEKNSKTEDKDRRFSERFIHAGEHPGSHS